ncbi:hypothetical protein P170DRAFT_436867 [Aspergillus steynii IBT 23096]|uniref:DUF7770 domain-containing protein n=1 Tax=Aspergillus steynii IBT 23096 TaxID=1392250 RepID=A0A2I2G8R4_9EURO|nr:uncharacterized protein P170DRAFT_436867 [Aspergillus steynii IBT 23096]PLB49248.1 hypothetical protein P170DRAFT_436867 [Aspergillus steynii IBT 23096]
MKNHSSQASEFHTSSIPDNSQYNTPSEPPVNHPTSRPPACKMHKVWSQYRDSHFRGNRRRRSTPNPPTKPRFQPYHPEYFDNTWEVEAIRLTLTSPGTPFHSRTDCGLHASLYIRIEGHFSVRVSMTQCEQNHPRGKLLIQYCTILPPLDSHRTIDIPVVRECSIHNITDIIRHDHREYDFLPTGRGCWSWVLGVIYDLESRGLLPSSPSSYAMAENFLQPRHTALGTLLPDQNIQG